MNNKHIAPCYANNVHVTLILYAPPVVNGQYNVLNYKRFKLFKLITINYLISLYMNILYL